MNMKHDARKLSDILKEMAERLLRNPAGDLSSEAMHVSLMFANIAWNEAVGLNHTREGYRVAWEEIANENPDMWSEFKSTDINAMIDDLVVYKNRHFPGDGRRILTCGIPNGNIRVEWLPAPVPGVDSNAEMQLYGLVKIGQWEEAIRFAQEHLKATRKIAEEMVAMAAASLGIEYRSAKDRSRVTPSNKTVMGRKTRSANPFAGRWRITSMEQWDQDYIDEEEEGYFEFDDKGSGKFHFGYVHGNMYCRTTTREGEPAVEWTWDGNDEMDPVQGMGWAVIRGNELHGKIYFHHGDDSGFVAMRVAKKNSRKKPK